MNSFEMPEQIEQSPEQLPVGEVVENVECKREGDVYVCVDEDSNIFMIEPGFGPADNRKDFIGSIQIEAVTHDDGEEETVYLAKYIEN